MYANSQKTKENSESIEISLKKLSSNIYEKFLSSHPEFKNLSTQTEEQILQKTLMGSIQDVLENFEEYLESYCTERLKNSR